MPDVLRDRTAEMALTVFLTMLRWTFYIESLSEVLKTHSPKNRDTARDVDDLSRIRCERYFWLSRV